MAETIKIEDIFEVRKSKMEGERNQIREAMASAVKNALVRGMTAKDIDEARAMITANDRTIYFSEIKPSDMVWLQENHHFIVYNADDFAYVKPDGLEELLRRQKAQDDEINGIVE